MSTRLIIALVAVSLASAAACSKEPAASQAPAAQPAASPAGMAGQPAVKPVPAELPEVVARVNGQPVKRDELQLAIRNLEGRAGSAVPPDQRDRVYREVLDRIVGYHLLAGEARARGIAAPPWDVDKRLTEIKSQFPNEQAFDEMLKQRGLTQERLRQETADTIAVNQMLEKEFEKVIVAGDAETRKFYDENKARFHEEASVRASHILVRVDEKADAATKAKAKAQADDLAKQLKKGADFAALARKHSQDPGSAPNGGDLGFFGKGQMVPAFAEAAFAAKPGQVTPVVESPFGYHLIKVAETKPEREVPYDEVKAQIGEYLKQQLREQKSQAFIDQLKARGKVEILL